MTGTFLHEAEALVHGLAAGERSGAPVQGFYLFTPLQARERRWSCSSTAASCRRSCATLPPVRGSQPEGEVIAHRPRAGARGPRPRSRRTTCPPRTASSPRITAAIAAAKGLARVAPFYVEADAAQNPGGWPRGGQTRLDLPNNHLQYALTWFGLALTLVAVFAAFAWQGLEAGRAQSRARLTGAPRA